MLLRQFTPFVPFLVPQSRRRWLVERVPLSSVQKMVGISDLLQSKSSEILREKKETLEEHGLEKKDIISVLRQ